MTATERGKAKRNPYLTTVTGREIDLVAPKWTAVDFKDVAHHLAHNCRYAGACRRTYTVAEHLLRGIGHCAPEVLPFWLAHDAHEAFSQDDATPKKQALPMVMEACLRGQFPLADIEKFKLAIETAFDEFELRHMRAVHEAAGLGWPVPEDIQREVKTLDRRMLVTEWRDLMPGTPPPGYEDAAPFDENFSQPFTSFGFEALRDAMLAAFVMTFPALREAAGARS
jgi:hypothetical protein